MNDACLKNILSISPGRFYGYRRPSKKDTRSLRPSLNPKRAKTARLGAQYSRADDDARSLHVRRVDEFEEDYANTKAALSVEGIISARISCVKIDFWGDEHGRLRQVVGTRGIGIWIVPAVTGCGHGSRAHETAGWTGDHWSYAKSRLDPTAATLPRGAGFSWQYHHHTLRFSNVYVGGFPWPDLAGTSSEALTFWRQRREPQMEVGKAGKNGE